MGSFMTAPAEPAEPLTNDFLTGLLAYWKLDESSSTFDDASVNAHVMTNYGAEYSSTGKILTCPSFVAANSDYLQMADNEDMYIYDQDISISAWIYLNSYPSSGEIMGIVGAGSQGCGYGVEGVGGSNAHLGIYNYGVTGVYSTGTISTGVWTHVVATFDNSESTNNVVFYINGTPETRSFNTTFNQYSYTRYLGKLGVTAYYFNGLIDEVAIWKGRILSGTNVTTLYTNYINGFGFDDFE